MSEPRCPATDLPESMCAHCRGHDTGEMPVVKLTTGSFGVPFLARYEGRCAICGEAIHVGDVTARIDPDIAEGYGCERCLP